MSYIANLKKNRSVLAFEQAFFALLEETPCDKISISDILRKSNYSRSAFYSNYLDKLDFIDKTMVAEATTYSKIVYNSVAKHVGSLFDGDIYIPSLDLFRHVYNNQSRYRSLFTGKIDSWDAYRFIRQASESTYQLYDIFSEPVPRLDYSLFNYVETNNYMGFISFWCRENFLHTPEDLALQCGLRMRIKGNCLPERLRVLE